jgi:hypothetical protein
MKAFKFRGADQIPYALDIILKQRLFCSDWRALNDPLEGNFSYSYKTLSTETGHALNNSDYYDELAEDLVREKRKKKVCALSLTAESKLLWAHYASGYTGVALEVELPENDLRVVRVQYIGAFNVDMNTGENSDSVVTRILSSKFDDWKYEQEIRIIQEDSWFPLTHAVSKVICGPRMNDAMFETFQIVCDSINIPLSRMHIDEEGIDLSGQRAPAAKFAAAYQKSMSAKPSSLP